MLSTAPFCLLLAFHFTLLNGHGDEHEETVTEPKATESRLLLISLDGFRYDYLNFLPAHNNFSRLFSRGVSAPEGISNAFETKTFPNHYSMLTGLYEESHGLLGNFAWDPDKNVAISLPINSANKNISYLYGGEPIYVTLAKATKSPTSVGCCMMVGCQLDLGGIHLPLSLPYNKSVSFKDRVDQVISWFTADHIRLGLIYYDQPDTVGHASGAGSLATMEVVRQLNWQVGYLLAQLEANKLLDSLNLIITSDHGMANVTNFVRIAVDKTLYSVVTADDVVWQIKPIRGKEVDAYDQLKLAVDKEKGAKVYKKEELPTEWHYGGTPRCAPIVVVAQLGYVLVNAEEDEVKIHQWTMTKLGTHGYDNRLKVMRPIFMASGPAFKRNVTTPEDFSLIDLYGLMCRVLGISPAPNNGSDARIHQILSSGASRSSWLFAEDFFDDKSGSKRTFYVVVICSLASVGFALLMVVAHRVRLGRRSSSPAAGYRQLGQPLLGGAAKFSQLNGLNDTEDDSEEEIILPSAAAEVHQTAAATPQSFPTGVSQA